MRTVLVRGGAAALVVGLAAAACSDDSSTSAGTVPSVVVTTSLLGDVVRNLVGDDVSVEVVMPAGADAHSFAPAPKQALAMREADVLVVNGLGFEEGLLDTVEAAERDGATVVTATDAIDDLDGDPHFFTDPVLMQDVVRHMADALVSEIDSLDNPAFEERVELYLEQLGALHAQIDRVVATVPTERRRLVTNHDVFSYFALRYGFEVLGTIVPAGDALAEPSPSRLTQLARDIDAAGVPAIFVESESSSRLTTALAGEGTAVSVVALYGETLGPPGSDADTYVGMMRTNATRIADALR